MSSSFTIRYNKIESTLKSTSKIGEAFDAKSTPRSKWPNFQACSAIWDTGATNTSITPKIVQRLGLIPIGKAQVSGVHGVKQVNKYLISIFLPNEVGWSAVEVYELNFIGGDILIGMDIISRGDLAVSNFGGKTTLSFRTPSQETIDFEIRASLDYEFTRNTKLTIKNKHTGEKKRGKWKKLKKLVELGD